MDTANAALTAEHDREYKAIQTANRRLTEDWEAKTAARNKAHAKACRDTDDNNCRMLSAWEAMNAPWLNEEKRLKQQLASAEAEINRLEAALFGQRKTSGEQFERKKHGADVSVASHTKVRQQYQSDLREAEQDSKRIQMEQHLDSFLIRQAKLKGITTGAIFSPLNRSAFRQRTMSTRSRQRKCRTSAGPPRPAARLEKHGRLEVRLETGATGK